MNPLALFDTISQHSRKIDEKLKDVPPVRIIAGTMMVMSLGALAVKTLSPYVTNFSWNDLVKRTLIHIPYVRQELQDEMNKLEQEIETKRFTVLSLEDVVTELPKNGMEVDKILQRLKSVEGNARSGKNTGAYYIDNKDIDDLIHKVCYIARRLNPLHTDLSPLVMQLENEVVSMCAKMFHGDENVCGNITTGGTDSIRHAVFTARERAKALVYYQNWEMVIPVTAHPAFEKAANEYSIKLRKAPIHPQTFEVDIGKMQGMINKNTILVVGSCPGFPHGIIDPIEQISDMLVQVDPKGKVGLHVDCCLGGFVIPFVKEKGYGFDVTRVTSLSADTHKYGYTEKGTSVVLYRNHENWKKHQIFFSTGWSGGIYATPTLPGSRSGRDIVATWAVMVYMGREGYVTEAKKIILTTRVIVEGLRKNPNFEVLGDPKAMVVAFRSKFESLNIHDLKAEMAEKGWYLSGLQFPSAVHLCTTAVHANNPKFVDDFLSDLEECAQVVLEYPEEKRGKSGDAVMYRTNIQLGRKEFIRDFIDLFWQVLSRVKPKGQINPS